MKEKDPIEQWMNTAGRREAPQAEEQAAAFAQVHAHWRRAVNRRRQTRWALAAVAVMAVGAVWLLRPLQTIEPAEIGRVLAAQGGTGQISSDGAHWRTLGPDVALHENDWIKTTADVGLAVQLNDQSQLRLQPNSAVRFTAQDELTLQHGALYHDTDAAQGGDALRVHTPFGTVQHIGTRYQVALESQRLNVAVRSGRVRFDGQSGAQDVYLGQQLLVNADGAVEQRPVSAHDDLWRWTQALAGDFDLQGKNLYDFIQWFSHENGYSVDWHGLMGESRNTRISGAIDGLPMDRSIEVIFLSTRFEYRVEDGVLHIGRKKA